jgi:hypothetical protein
MEHKPIKLLGLFIVLIFIMACSLPGGGATQPVEATEEGAATETATQVQVTEDAVESSKGMPVMGDGLCANPYYPVREGSTWGYSGTSSAAPDYSYTDTITSIRTDGFTLTTQYDNLTRTQEWSCTPEGISAVSMGGGLSTSMSNLVIETQSASGVTYPASINAGDTWQHQIDFTGTMDIAGQAGEASGSVISDFTALGTESVTVAAGTFDAMKVEVHTTFDALVEFQGTSVPVMFISTSTSWFAQGVGWLRSESSSEFMGQPTTETVELQWFNIP